MFTSRAEHRLLLREDNADLRLTEAGYKLGLVNEQRWCSFAQKRESIEREKQRLHSIWLHPGTSASTRVAELTGAPLSRETTALEVLRRPQLDYAAVTALPGVGGPVEDAAVAEQIEIQTKYAGYVNHQQLEIEKTRAQEHLRLPPDLDYALIPGLSTEIVQKLATHRPETLGQAGRMAGITPAAISILRIYLKHPQTLAKIA
jgi:tRNA uridine 5-carboxymethylaminomethyl modification enzyme